METIENLKLIPENRFKSAIANISESTSICPNCGKLATAENHPYAYDPENNDIWYMSICPHCGATMYSHD